MQRQDVSIDVARLLPAPFLASLCPVHCAVFRSQLLRRDPSSVHEALLLPQRACQSRRALLLRWPALFAQCCLSLMG